MNKQQSIEELFNSIEQLRKLLQFQVQESYEERAATIMQFLTLTHIKDQSTSTVGDIAAHLKLSKSSATQLIERLVKIDLVKRIDDKEDRRIVRLSITLAGEKEIIRLRKKYLERLGKIFSRIPDQDLKEMTRIHNTLIKTLQIEQKE